MQERKLEEQEELPDVDAPVYTPEQQAYLNSVYDYQTQQGQAGYSTRSLFGNVAQPEDIDTALAAGMTPSQIVQLGHAFMTNKGNPAGTIYSNPDAQYRLVNEHGSDRVAFQGQGIAGLDDIYRQATQLSQTEGKKANWGVEVLDPATGQWSRVANDDPAKGIGGALMKIAAVAAPVLGAILLPGLGAGIGTALTTALGTAGTAGLGAALGSAALGTAKGDSFGDILKSAAISGVGGAAGAGVLGGSFGSVGHAVEGALGAGVGSGVGSGVGAGAGAGVGSAAGTAAGDAITIIGSKALGSAASGLAGALGGASSAAFGNAFNGYDPYNPTPVDAYGNPVTPDIAPPDIVVNAGGALPNPVNPGVVGGALGASGIADAATPSDPNEIVVNAQHPLGVDTSAAAGVGGGALANTLNIPEAPPEEDIVVKARNDPAYVPPDIGPLFDGTVQATTPAIQEQIQQATQPEADKGMSISDIANYLRLAGAVVGIGGGLFGKKGSGGKMPALGGGGLGGAAFTGKLPDLTAAQSAIHNQTPRVMPAQDWSSYGFRPEQSFYTGVPQNYTPPAFGVEDPRFPSIGKGYAGGGGARSFAVRGPGTERSDSIPAYLSDGEYVIDAPTVRAIGAGSREAGFKRLDDLRVHVRKKTPKKALKSLGGR